MIGQRPRRLATAGVAALVIGLVVTVAGLLPASAGAAETQSATLHGPHVGATNPGFQTGACPEPPGEYTWGWHFVLQGNDTTFVSISVTFEHAGVITEFISHPTAKHAYVYTPGPDTLLGATAEVDGPDTTFVLSHVCAGDEEPTTTTTEDEEPTTTTTEDEEPTTTTTEDEEPTTTTTEDEEPTTTTTEDEEPTTTTTEDEEPTTTTTEDEEPTTTTGAQAASTEQPTSTAGAVAAAADEEAPALAVLGSSESPSLPRTGSATTVLLALGLSLVTGGLLLLLGARRMRTS